MWRRAKELRMGAQELPLGWVHTNCSRMRAALCRLTAHCGVLLPACASAARMLAPASHGMLQY